MIKREKSKNILGKQKEFDENEDGEEKEERIRENGFS